MIKMMSVWTEKILYRVPPKNPGALVKNGNSTTIAAETPVACHRQQPGHRLGAHLADRQGQVSSTWHGWGQGSQRCICGQLTKTVLSQESQGKEQSSSRKPGHKQIYQSINRDYGDPRQGDVSFKTRRLDTQRSVSALNDSSRFFSVSCQGAVVLVGFSYG